MAEDEDVKWEEREEKSFRGTVCFDSGKLERCRRSGQSATVGVAGVLPYSSMSVQSSAGLGKRMEVNLWTIPEPNVTVRVLLKYLPLIHGI